MATIFRISILGLAHTVHSSRDLNGIRIGRLVMTQCCGENSVFLAQFCSRNLQNLDSPNDRYRTIL